MRIRLLTFAVLGLLAACSSEPGAPAVAGAAIDPGTDTSTVGAMAPVPRAGGIADLPDHGALLGYSGGRGAAAVTRGAYTWHPVKLSEEHALRAVAGGEMVVTAPDGRPIRLQYARHVEHADGNWTWIGREPGAAPGTEAIITFGEKAVFGTVPDGDGPALRLTSTSGRTWLVETDPKALAALETREAHPREPDFRLPPRLSLPASAGSPATASAGATSATTGATTAGAATTVDLLIGYTSGFAASLGGQSQVATRLNYLVAVANQAYANSQVDMQVRLVHSAQVSYPDNTSNEDALYDLTGVECTEQTGGSLSCSYVGPDAALQPLHAARNQYGADLVSLVRDFNEPENAGCGLAWINGGGQVPLTTDDEITGLSVLGDGTDPADDGSGTYYYCQDETLAHELGHNMGSAHDRDTADGDDNVLQMNEYGRYPYSFGYKTGATGFYTVMAYGDSGQTRYRVFSNPAITYCGGPCGVANQADNARSLRLTVPIVAGFRATVVPESNARYDFNGDGVSDVLWRHATTGNNTIWLSADKAVQQPTTRVANLAWRMVGAGDIDADGNADIVWRNVSTGANTIWLSGRSSTTRSMAGVSSQAWQVAGVGDFDGDGADDVLWRNGKTGANTIWKSASRATQQAMTTITNLHWRIVGVGDLDGDGRDDVVWRNDATGANSVWYSGNYATRANLKSVANLAWEVVGVGDFNGDGRDDLLWRNASTGANTIWQGGSAAAVQVMSGVANLAWRVEGAGDFDGNSVDDVLWRNHSSGANTIWRAARSSDQIRMYAVTSQAWEIQP